jgi:hypothetical protein
MSYLLWCVSAAWLAYAVFIVRFMRNILTKKTLYLKTPNIEDQAKYRSAARYDFVNIQEFKVYLGAVFLLPVRVIMAIPIFFLGYILILIMKTIYGGMPY